MPMVLEPFCATCRLEELFNFDCWRVTRDLEIWNIPNRPEVGFRGLLPINARTQSEVPGDGTRVCCNAGAGHFRLGRLNEAAGVSADAAGYGY